MLRPKARLKMSGIFITGTDTAVGKTVVTGLLARYLLAAGYSTITQKWIQTGCDAFPPDIAAHLQFAPVDKQPLDDICPYRFSVPASPHLAAANDNTRIDPARITESFNKLAAQFDFVLVEGIGGILVPFNSKSLVIDIAAGLKLPVIIVAKNRLGAINHTLLTIEAAKARAMRILGIVFNESENEEPALITEDNPKIIADLTGETILGVLLHSVDKNTLIESFEPIGERLLGQLEGARNE